MERIVVLISGRGSNLRALLEAGLPVVGVISNRPDAGGLAIARSHGIDTAVVDHQRFSGREIFDAELAKIIDGFRPDLVVLAGFMRILTAGFVERYAGRLINIHPSLL
ncbi:MAG: phosphoribosylglycinamide formyltransferase, partial [Burkholderiales bacterium]|nr:phosphoribosylglycinamide formyltransferase [Burkholderiales bacterium]